MTYFVIFLAVAVSLLCFNNRTLFYRLALEPYMVWHKKQWYRVVSHGFVHGDYVHLLINMLVLWSFGSLAEDIIGVQHQAGIMPSLGVSFALLYFGGIIIASMYDVVRRRNDINFVSVGASGAVSAVIFFTIFFVPLNKIYFFGLIPIPGILFGALYLIYEFYLARQRQDNVNHYAHISGAIYGFIFPMLFDPSQISIFFDGFSR